MPLFNTEQEVLDHVVPKLLEQNMKSRGEEFCRYRGPNGLKCAIGHCIPDEMYNPDFDESNTGTGIDDMKIKYYSIFDKIFHPDNISLNFLIELQNIHDEGLLSDWRKSFTSLAKEYDLKVNF